MRHYTAAGAVTAFTVAIGCTAFTQAGFLVNFQEIGPRYVGALHGMANTAGSFAGIVGTYMTGVILESTVGRCKLKPMYTALGFSPGH